MAESEVEKAMAESDFEKPMAEIRRRFRKGRKRRDQDGDENCAVENEEGELF